MSDNSTYTNKVYVPKTGQTTSYADFDDGYYQKGNPISPRFVDNGDGTVTDRATGLMWPKDPQHLIPGAVGVTSNNLWVTDKGNWATSTSYVKGDIAKDTSDATYWVCCVAHTSAGAETFANDRTANPTYWREQKFVVLEKGTYRIRLTSWLDAITNSEGLEFAGYTDWRLPNVFELVTILNMETAKLDSIFYAPATYQNLWSSTTVVGATANAYMVVSAGLASGSSFVNSSYAKTINNFMSAFPVRGGN